MASQAVPRRPIAEDLSTILDSPETGDLIDRLQTTRGLGNAASDRLRRA